MLKIVDNKIYMVRGDDEELDVVTKNADGTDYEMQPEDILTLTVRSKPTEDSLPLIQISSAPGSTRIVIRHEDTAEMAYGSYSADVQLMTGDGRRKTVWPDLDTGATSTRMRASNIGNFNLASEVTML